MTQTTDYGRFDFRIIPFSGSSGSAILARHLSTQRSTFDVPIRRRRKLLPSLPCLFQPRTENIATGKSLSTSSLPRGQLSCARGARHHQSPDHGHKRASRSGAKMTRQMLTPPSVQVWRSAGFSILANDFGTLRGAECSPNTKVDVFRDELRRAIAHHDLNAALVSAACGEHRGIRRRRHSTGQAGGRLVVAVVRSVDSVRLRAVRRLVRRELGRVAPPGKPTQITSRPLQHFPHHQRCWSCRRGCP